MKYQGIPGAGGIATARLFCFREEKLSIRETIVADGLREQEQLQYHRALEQAQAQLQEIFEACLCIDEDKANIFQAHMDILQDLQVREEIDAAILWEGKCATWAVQTVYDQYAEVLVESDDALIRERAADLRDVSERICRILLGVAPSVSLSALPKGTILVAHDLLPSQTVSLKSDSVCGIVTEVGGATSHTAILARSFGIPAVLGIPDILEKAANGTAAILDGTEGVLITEPTAEELAIYEQKRENFLRQREYEKTFLPQKAVTADGTAVEIHLNIGDGDDSHYAAVLPYVDGVGLFRSEFLYLARKQLPSEEEQYEIYARTLKNFGDRPVILRTLDIGGDKKTECIDLPHEDNPFLGLRALRLCFAQPELFRTQLRAAYRASVHGNLWLMFPMVSSMDDIRRAKAFCRQVQDELCQQGMPFCKDVKLGIMIETPSMAILAAEAAQEVDFASIGTNDLCQYTLAVDRMNPTVRPYYMPYHPAVLRLIAYVAKSFRAAGKPVSICGEMGGDPKILPVLVGLGIQKVSMSPSAVAAAKAAICRTDFAEAVQRARTILSLPTEEEIRKLL